MRFTLKNMTQAVMILKMHEHLQSENQACHLKDDDALFRKDFYLNAEIMHSSDKVDEKIMSSSCGAYLFIDSNQNSIIRAGSTCTSFKQRYQEHTRSSKFTSENSRKSTLYCRYPHDEAHIDNGLKCMQRGKWSRVWLVSGLRWEKRYMQEIVDLFEWDTSVTSWLDKSNVSMTMIDKKEKMVSFLFETVLGLCIAPSMNVSSNPSYECFNGRSN